jgi:hypothetical protein
MESPLARHRAAHTHASTPTSFLALLTAVLVAALALPAAVASADPGERRHGAAATANEKGASEKGASEKGASEKAKGHGRKDAKGDKGEKGDPPGNNGTVKIAPVGEDDGTPDNNPHPGCAFQIEWYGFDEGPDIESTVTFEMQAPTSDVGLSGTDPEKVFVGEDPATGAGTDSGHDATQEYTLAFAGDPHPQQGYHLKLTVHTPYSQGSDTKHKVYWVEGCEEDSEEPEAEAGAAVDEQGPPEESEAQTEDNPTEVPGEQAEDDTEVLGAQASAQDNPGTQAADQSADSSATVPTSVDAGTSGTERLRSAIPAMIILLGLAVAGAALVRRRTRA